jgi:hypothetical protein
MRRLRAVRWVARPPGAPAVFLQKKQKKKNPKTDKTETTKKKTKIKKNT